MSGIVRDQNTDSLSDSIVNIGDDEVKECAIEELEPFKDALEAQGFDLNELGTSDLVEIWKNIEHFNDTELNDASDLADLIKGEIAGFSE